MHRSFFLSSICDTLLPPPLKLGSSSRRRIHRRPVGLVRRRAQNCGRFVARSISGRRDDRAYDPAAPGRVCDDTLDGTQLDLGCLGPGTGPHGSACFCQLVLTKKGWAGIRTRDGICRRAGLLERGCFCRTVNLTLTSANEQCSSEMETHVMHDTRRAVLVGTRKGHAGRQLHGSIALDLDLYAVGIELGAAAGIDFE